MSNKLGPLPMFYGSTVEHRQGSTISDLYESRSDLFEFSAAILEKGLFFGQNADDSGKSTRVKTGNTRLVGYFV